MSEPKFKLGDVVQYEYREIRQADVIDVRWVPLGQSGIFKYKLSDGRELVGSALTKVGEA